MADKRVDIISDTHGYISDELKRELRGADVIVHAGDITSSADFALLKSIAPLHLCLGNNDYAGQYGPDIKRVTRFSIDGVRFQVAHHEEQLKPASADVCVFGHSHKPSILRSAEGGQVLRRRLQSKPLRAMENPGQVMEAVGYSDAGALDCLDEGGAWLINPGSPTLPRTPMGPTMARLWIRDGLVEDPQIIQLPVSDMQMGSPWFRFGL